MATDDRRLVAAIGEREARCNRSTMTSCVAARSRFAPAPTTRIALVEAFALTREAARRVLGLRLHDVQIAGGLVLARGAIAEMATGEGKTLAAVAPALPRRARRPRLARAHLQRLPRAPRRGVDGSGLRAARRHRRRGAGRDAAGGAARGVRARRHLRDGEGGRLRLPARRALPSTRRPGAPLVRTAAGRDERALSRRDRRRGGLDPDRRGAHPPGDRGRRRRRGRRAPAAPRRDRAPARARRRVPDRRVRAQRLPHRPRRARGREKPRRTAAAWSRPRI